MVEPIGTAAVVGLITNTLKFATTGLEILRDGREAPRRAAAHRDELANRIQMQENEFDQRLKEYTHQHHYVLVQQLQKLQLDQERDMHRLKLDRYPIREGPGELRNSYRYRNDTDAPPLVLLLPDARKGSPWVDLPRSVRAMLMHLTELAAVPRVLDRAIEWPHGQLLEADLLDIPTIVVRTEVLGSRLILELGGCNLGGNQPIRQMVQVTRALLPQPGAWTSDEIRAFEASGTNVFIAPGEGDPDRERALQLEWAARVVTVAIVAAVDAYHLLRSPGYAEQIDEAVNQLGPSADPHLLARIPEQPSVDPAFHQLHRARRLRQAGDTPAASAAVDDALSQLAQEILSSQREAVRAARSRGALQPWHADLLRELGEGDSGVVSAEALAALDEVVDDGGPATGTASATLERHDRAGRAHRESAPVLIPETREVHRDNWPRRRT